MVGLEVHTHYVGNNSEIKIEISDKSGKKIETIKAKISVNHYLELNRSSSQYK